jgi:D-sedoheptulose 7-phosphate isomerase
MYNSESYLKVLNSLLTGDIILVSGNGGSFSDSCHFVAELIGRYDNDSQPIPSMVLGSNGAELTALANDFEYKNIYLPYIIAFKRFNPSYLFISTSGTSSNIINAIDLALLHDKSKVSLLTSDKCLDSPVVQYYIERGLNILNVNSMNTQEIQEWHIKILHKLAGDIKKGYYHV